MAAQTDLVLARFRAARCAPPRRPLPPRPPMSLDDAIAGLVGRTMTMLEPVFAEQFAAISRGASAADMPTIAEMLAYSRPVEEPSLVPEVAMDAARIWVRDRFDDPGSN